MKHHNPRHYFSPEEDAHIRADYPTGDTAALAQRLGLTVGAVQRRASRLGVQKTTEFMRQLGQRQAATRRARGYTAGQFPKGHVPWSKGKKGLQIGGRETQFQKGHQRNPTVPIGHERIDAKDGYLIRKIREDGPASRKWRAVHILVWEAAHGPLPPGHAVAFKDRGPRHTDITLDRLELITRAELLRRNTIHRFPEPIRLALAMKARLTRVINAKTRQLQEEPAP